MVKRTSSSRASDVPRPPRKTAAKTRGRSFEPGNSSDPPSEMKVSSEAAVVASKGLDDPKTSTHKLTTQERAALTDHLARRKKRNPAPRVRVIGTGKAITLSVDHPDRFIGGLLLSEALGTTEFDLVNEVLQQLGHVATVGGSVDEAALNFLLSVIKDMKPRDPVEIMLVAQMAAVHASTMDLAGRLSKADSFTQAEFAEQGLNKLARTFTTQIEALTRYRGGGEQRVVVQHQHVNVAAGQAQVNVGSPRPGGGALPKPKEQSHEKLAALPHAPEQEMPCAVETDRGTVPSSGGTRLECLPQPRGRRRRAER